LAHEKPLEGLGAQAPLSPVPLMKQPALISFLVLLPLQQGQQISSFSLKTSFSKQLSQVSHLYSKMGISKLL
jgi:hypothetical protein